MIKIKCEICGKEFQQITSTHLKKHNITLGEYKDLYPKSLIVSNEISQKLINANIEKWNNPEYKERVSNTISKVISNQWESGKYNRTQSEDHKRKRGESQSKTKRNNSKKYSGKNAGHYKHYHSVDSILQMSKNSEGNKNGNWKGGIANVRDHIKPKGQCIKLNDKFIGSNGHHIMGGTIIYIPIYLHQSISHDLKNNKNMKEINNLALNWLRGDYK